MTELTGEIGPQVKRGFYPVTIQETRYGGAYARGKWAIFAGVYNPDAHTEAFGSDTECNAFWNRARREGPVITIDDPRHGGETEIYVASGNDPNGLVNELVDYGD